MKKVTVTFGILIAALTLCASCGALKDQSYWFCHVLYSDVFGGCQPGATGDPRYDLLTEAWTMPECSDLKSDNRGYPAIRNPDEAQKTCMDRAYTKMLDRGLGTGPGEVGRVLFCMSLGSAEEMQKKMNEYAAKSRAPKGAGACDPKAVEFDAATDTLFLPSGCTYAYLGADASEGLDCNGGGGASCEAVDGEDTCTACAKERCCPGYQKCYGDATSQNACSCRFECESVGALDGCATCAEAYGNPNTNVSVLSLAGCLKVECRNTDGTSKCPLFLNY